LENIPWTPVLRRVADSLFLLQGLSEEERRTLWAGAPLPVRFEKGESIYSCHAFRRALGVMLQGEAQVWRAGEDGRRVVMNRLPAGSVFGAAALFGECEAYVTEISALRRCAVLFVSQQQASDWMRGHYAIAENYIRFLSGRIRFLNQKIAEFTDGQTEDRLVRYFLDHRSGDGRVILPGSLTELAQTLNIGRSSLYRSLDALTASGAVRREGRRIFVDDPARLRTGKAAE
jgi:hypothetical protein